MRSMSIVSDHPIPVVLITGAAARIGAALASDLHAQGYRVVLHCNRSLDRAAALAGKLNALRPDSARVVQADLLDTSQVVRLASEALGCWGRLDVLVNNASSFYPVALADLTEPDWVSLMHSNAKAPLFLCRELFPALTTTGGCVLNLIDSTALQGLAGYTPYAMAKAALANMTFSLARELAPRVRVNGISPGIILWPENRSAMTEEEKAEALQHTALKRMGSVEDITAAALFLIREASYVTGQVIRVDGGAALAG